MFEDEVQPHHTMGDTALKVFWWLLGIAAVVFAAHWFWNSH